MDILAFEIIQIRNDNYGEVKMSFKLFVRYLSIKLDLTYNKLLPSYEGHKIFEGTYFEQINLQIISLLKK